MNNLFNLKNHIEDYIINYSNNIYDNNFIIMSEKIKSNENIWCFQSQKGGLDARELKAGISALNIKITKEEIRNIYSDFGKEIREKILRWLYGKCFSRITW